MRRYANSRTLAFILLTLVVNITIAALSLSIGLGFTQVPDMFNIFPSMVRTIFAENCVAVVFLAAIIMNLVMPKEREV